MKTIVAKQREERDKLLSFEYQKRSSHAKAVLYRDSRPIKLITGPRRAGKSVLAIQMLLDKNFAYLNFDDTALLEKFSEDAVEQALGEVYPGYEFLLLDEIQNLDGWSMWVEKLYRNGVNMVITGSNANLLSYDLAAVLSGRYVEIRLFPFSAMEYMEYLDYSVESETPSQTAKTNNCLEMFMKLGGYPEIAKTPQVTSGYLSALYDSIIMKDIVRRYKVRKVEELYNVADWLLSNFTNPFSATSLAEELSMSSVLTIQKFTSYLQNTFLFQYLPRFSNKLKLMKKADRKAYVVDNGYIMARAFELSANMGKLLENLVFQELLKRGYDIEKYELFYYHSRNDKETDFVCRRGVKVEQMIQVCYDMSATITRKREVKSLTECAGELKCDSLSIITWNQEETIEWDGYKIMVIPLRKWILEKF
ncbi:MAG: ATP-binding protein [Alistipes sp.]|nr:ATP-binding protein [Candidatus Alistipes equi]